MNFQALKPAMYRSDRTGKRLDTKEIERQIGGDIPDALHRLLKDANSSHKCNQFILVL